MIKIQHFQGKIIQVATEMHALPDGTSTCIELVEHPGGAAILPVFENGDILLIEQYRPAVEGYIWEIPAGKLDADEAPRKAALRELKEETGYQAKSLKKMGHIFTTPGFCDEVIYIFKAQNLKYQGTELEEGELIECYRFSPAEIKKMIRAGEIEDAKTLAALSLHFL